MADSTPQLQLRVLGRLELRREGQALELPARKHTALLACLALQPGAVPRSRLLAWLWPDSDPSAARASLRQALSALRRVAGDALLHTSGDDVGLGPSVDVDLWRFQALAAGPGSHEQMAALALHGGPLLDGLDPGAPALHEEILARRAAHAAQLERLLQAAVDGAGDDARARQALAERWLACDPASERAYRVLIDACRCLGDKAAGVRAYQRCRIALAEAYGVNPSSETEQVYRALLQDQAETSAAPPSTVLVLPIQPQATGDADLRALALLSAGLTQDVTTELTRFRTLAVMASHTAEAVADRPPLDAAREVNARFVLTGSMRPTTTAWRLSMQLTDAQTGVAVWSERYDSPRGAVPEVADPIVRAVVAALAVEIDAQVFATSRRRTGALSAYEQWVQGVTLLKQGSLEADEQARARFECALLADPGYARAYTGLSLSYFNEWSCQHWDRWELTQREALRHALRAVELDPADHVALCILAKIELYRRQFDAADAHFHRALRLNPNDADNVSMVALGLGYLGQADLALEIGQAAIRLNPRHPVWYLASCYLPLLLLDRFDEAIRAAEPAVGSYVDTHGVLAIAHALSGRTALAHDHARAFMADFHRMITPGRPATPQEAGRWMFDVNPLRLEGHQERFREGLRAAGLW